MKLITSITVQQADHDEVIDNAADQIGRAANRAFLFFIRKEIQGWKNLTLLCSWGLSRLSDKHGPIFNEVKESAIAVYRKGCQQETEFVQELIKTQLTDRLDARWKIHDQAIAWFNDQTQAFLADNPVEDDSEGGSDDQVLDLTEEGQQTTPVVEDEPSITLLDETPVPVLDPPVDPDPLDDGLGTEEDSIPVSVASTIQRRNSRTSIADLIKEEAAKV